MLQPIAQPTRSSDSRTRCARSARSTSAKRIGNSTFSVIVIDGIRWNAWKTMPTSLRRYAASSSDDIFARSRPWTSTEPEVGRSSPAIKFSSVDFPEPDCPSKATNSPGSMVSETPSTARIRLRPWDSGRHTFSVRTAAKSWRSANTHLCPIGCAAPLWRKRAQFTLTCRVRKRERDRSPIPVTICKGPASR